jgi:hypothetical protein
MINKEIGVSLIALTLVVVVSLFNATNVYADSYKHKDKGLRVIIDLVKEDIRDHVYDRYDGEHRHLYLVPQLE